MQKCGMIDTTKIVTTISRDNLKKKIFLAIIFSIQTFDCTVEP